MSQRTKVVGTHPRIIWLLIVIAVVVVAALAVGVLIIYPSYQRQQQVEQHYQAGVAFQAVEDWDKAAEAFEKVIAIDATYKDAQTRLAEMKAKQQEALAMEQAKAAQATATAQARAEATAAAATVEAGIVQATSVATTATAQARATTQAQEVKVTATAEALAQLEVHYQKGLAYMNMARWEEAKAELEQVFNGEPNYKDVQAKLAQVEAELEKLTPTPTPTPMVTPTPVVHAYDDCSQEPGSTVCCCFVQYHVHDLGRVFGEGTEIRIVWQAGTPGGNCPGGKALFSVSTDMIAWTDIGQATVAPRQGFADIRHTEEFVAPVGFRFVKVDIPECYNDYSSAEVNY